MATVQTKTATTGGTPTTDLTATFDTPVVSGHALFAVVLIGFAGSTNIVVTMDDDQTQTWTEDVFSDRQAGAAQFGVSIFRFSSSASGVAAVTAHFNSSMFADMVIVEVDDTLSGVQPEDSHAPAVQGTTTPNAGTLGTGTSSLMFAGLATNQTGDPTEDAAWTLLVENSGGQDSAILKRDPLIGGSTPNWTVPVNAACYACSAAYRLAAPVTGAKIVFRNRLYV